MVAVVDHRHIIVLVVVGLVVDMVTEEDMELEWLLKIDIIISIVGSDVSHVLVLAHMQTEVGLVVEMIGIEVIPITIAVKVIIIQEKGKDHEIDIEIEVEIWRKMTNDMGVAGVEKERMKDEMTETEVGTEVETEVETVETEVETVKTETEAETDLVVILQIGVGLTVNLGVDH